MTGSLEGGSDQFSRSVMSDSLRPHGLQPSNRLILCRPLLLLPPIPPSIRVFSNESALRIRWPEYWSFSFSISPSNEQPGLVSFGTDWLDLLAVQGTLKSLLQHHSSKASILWCSAFFIVQLSHPYRTTGKTTALTRGRHTQLLTMGLRVGQEGHGSEEEWGGGRCQGIFTCSHIHLWVVEIFFLWWGYFSF